MAKCAAPGQSGPGDYLGLGGVGEEAGEGEGGGAGAAEAARGGPRLPRERGVKGTLHRH